MLDKNTRNKRTAPTRLPLTVAVIGALAAIGSTPSSAFMIDSGNRDVSMRWDNTVRYNAGWRMEDPHPAFGNAVNYDETENTFKKHDMVTNRLDLLSEFDFVYQGSSGFRVSAAAWSENAYKNATQPSPLISSTFTGANAVPSNYTNGKYNGYAKRYATGSSAEFLDAFVFGKFELGSTTLNVKAGQHNVYWGEALYTVADGVSAGQGPLDTIKGAGSPGSETKELFMPLKQISAQWSLTPELSVMGQYLLDWKPYRLVPGGTYFSAADPTRSDCANVGPGTCMPNLADIGPERKKGNFGLGLRWNPGWLEGSAGLYYRKYDEKLPWSSVQMNAFGAVGLRMSYARDTELLGASVQKNLGPVNTGFEVTYRRNAALNSVAGFLAGSQGYASADFFTYLASPGANIAASQAPAYGLVEGARGNTYHAVLNAIWLMPNTGLWEAGVLQGELSYQRLDKVTRNSNLYYSVDYACKDGYMSPFMIATGSRSAKDGCSTKDSLAFNLGFTPQWLEVIPGMLLSMPTSLSYGLIGNSPTLGGSSKGSYSYSIGLTALYHALYEFGVAYADAHVDYGTAVNPANGVGSVYDQSRSPMAVQNSHGWLSFHFKTSF